MRLVCRSASTSERLRENPQIENGPTKTESDFGSFIPVMSIA